ncbi:MAG: methylated-DNA--[protein]-cysteine S-methyltransferase [Pseudomonadota bacterium]
MNKGSAPALTREVASPFGPLMLSQRGDAIVALDWCKPEKNDDTPLLREGERQLAAYFAGELRDFDLPLEPGGDEFQQQVCEAMCEIPYGETVTYGDIAKKLDTAAQPVGNACGGNTIPIIIPCHRVLGASSLGGYSGEGGVERKIELLKLEGGFPYLL